MSLLKQRLLRNTFFNVVGHFWTLLLGLLLTPILISYLGLPEYGLYIVMTSILSWSWILDLGVPTALMRYLSDHAARGDEQRFSECLSTAMVIRIGSGMLIAAIGIFAGGWLARVLDVPDPSAFRRVWLLFCLTTAISNLSQVWNAVLSARHRMDLVIQIGLVLSLPSAVAVVATVAAGGGLRGFLLVNLGVAVMYFLLSGTAALRAGAWKSGVSFRPGRRSLLDLGSFSRRQTVARLAETILATGDRLALRRDLPSVSVYQVGATVAARLRDMVALLVSAGMPAATDLYAREDWKGVEKLFHRGTKYLVLIGFPLMLFAALFAEEILVLWMGTTFVESARVLRILLAGYFLNVIAAMAATLGAAANRMEIQERMSLLAVGVLAVAYFGWGRFHGVIGVATSISLAYAAVGLGQLIGMREVLKGRVIFEAGALFGRPVAATLLAALVGIPAKWLALERWDLRTRPIAGLFVAGTALLAVAAYAGALRCLRVLDAEDWDLFKSFFRRAPGEAASRPAS
ncbi:MAG TPA: oligosaccharide flippase family protein [Planctomycetota bacterium]|nr:oligosaccharide flippase family protein [Planctomycetota bacterium]